jgi:hypothetical protein
MYEENNTHRILMGKSERRKVRRYKGTVKMEV